MTCNCGQPMVWQKFGVVMQCTHGSAHGIVWLQNNETYIRRKHWQRGPAQRHIGTFPTLEVAMATLEKALSRVQH